MINAHPSYPPLSLIVLYNMLCEKYRVLPACHSHSSVSSLGVSSQLRQAFGNEEIDRNRHGYQVALTLIWKDGKIIFNLVSDFFCSPARRGLNNFTLVDILVSFYGHMYVTLNSTDAGNS